MQQILSTEYYIVYIAFTKKSKLEIRLKRDIVIEKAWLA